MLVGWFQLLANAHQVLIIMLVFIVLCAASIYHPIGVCQQQQTDPARSIDRFKWDFLQRQKKNPKKQKN